MILRVISMSQNKLSLLLQRFVCKSISNQVLLKAQVEKSIAITFLQLFEKTCGDKILSCIGSTF